jgi:hypothetical protein
LRERLGSVINFSQNEKRTEAIKAEWPSRGKYTVKVAEEGLNYFAGGKKRDKNTELSRPDKGAVHFSMILW